MAGWVRPRALLLVGVLAAVLLAGCSRTVEGTPPPKGDDLVQSMLTAVGDRAQGFEVRYTADVAGKRQTLDARVLTDRARASFTLEGKTAELRRVGSTSYARADVGFWVEYSLDADDAKALGTNWVTLVDGAGLANLLAPGSFLTPFRDPSETSYVGVRRGELDGRAAWRFRLEPSSATVSIAADGPPLLLQIGSDSGDIDFAYPTDELQVDEPTDAVPYPGSRRAGVTRPPEAPVTRRWW